MQSVAGNNKHYDNLSLIRLVACLMVLMVHLGGRITLPGAIEPFFEAGSSGVTLFFVLSGFLGVDSLCKNRQKGGTLGKWYLGKLVRILPVYYVAIVIYAIVYELVLKTVPVDRTGLYWFRYVFCINGIVPTDEVFWANLGAVWTVSVFLIWYLILPLIGRLVRSFWTGAIGFCVFFALEKGIDFFGGWGSPFKYLQYCMLGVVLYYAVKEGREKLLAAISVVILYLLIIKGSDSALVPAMVTLIFACVTMELTVRVKFVRSILHFSDTYSYGIYLMQGVAALVLDLLGVQGDLIIIVGFIGITALLAILVHYIIEKPMMRLLKRV